MSQLRLDKFFDFPRQAPSGLTFLDLPIDIRHRIYEEAGLVKGRIINLNHRGTQISDTELLDESDGLQDSQSLFCTPSDDEIINWKGSLITYNLLQTSSAIYNEIIPIIYSSNAFMIRRRDRGDLQSLQNLSPESLASPTHLVIRLNVACCDFEEECVYFGRANSSCRRFRHGKLLGNISRADKAVIMEWKCTVARFASHVKPHHLSIEFTCDTENYETAKQVIVPFAQLSPLKSCDIRLSCYPDPELRQLAEETAVRATGGTIPIDSFPFTSLPKELQIRILYFCNLIAPSEIEWKPGHGFRLRDDRCACIESRLWLGRYCQHAAFSERCKCWLPSTALFLVDHAMRRIALEIFYSQNRFIVVPLHGRYQLAPSTPDRVEASLFLRDVVPAHAVHHLRSLEIVFPEFEGDYLAADSPGYQDWLSTISCLAEYANLPKLTLKVRMLDVFRIPYREGLDRQRTIVLDMYRRVLAPLELLKGLKDIFIHFTSPVEPQEWRLNTYLRELKRREAKQLEQTFERMIMGEGYDSGARGKDGEDTSDTVYWDDDDDEWY